MENRELDRRCAEILGMETDWRGDVPVYRWENNSGTFTSPVPNYSTSLDACQELLKWVKEDKSRVNRFSLEIAKTIGLCDVIIRTLMTTPRQIAEAFVECFGGHDDPITGSD